MSEFRTHILNFLLAIIEYSSLSGLELYLDLLLIGAILLLLLLLRVEAGRFIIFSLDHEIRVGVVFLLHLLLLSLDCESLVEKIHLVRVEL